MKKLSILLSLLLTLAFVATSFTGCGKTSQTGDSSSSSSNLEDFTNAKIVLFAASDSDEISEAVKEAGNKWRDDYGGKVEYLYGTDWNQRMSKLATLIATGQQLDVYYSGTYGDVPKLPVKNMTLPVDEYLEDTDEISVDLSKKGFSFNGKTYGFATKYNYLPMSIIYNKTIFDNNGEKTPHEYYKENNWTWDTFRKVAKDLTQDLNNDGVIDQYGYGSWLPQLFMQSAGVADYIDADYKLNLDDPRIAKTAQFMQECGFKDKSFVPGIWDGINYFLSGKLAMYGERSSYVGYSLEHGLTDEVDFAPFPQSPDNNSQVKYGAWIDGYSILSNTKNAAASAKFIKSYLAPVMSGILKQERSESQFWKGYTDEQQKLIDEMMPNSFCLNSMGYNDFDTISREMWTSIYRDGKSPSSVFASGKPKLQAQLDACLSDNKIQGVEDYTPIGTIDFENGMAPMVEKTTGCANLEGALSGNQSLTVTCPQIESGSNPPVLINTDAATAKLPSGHTYNISLKYSLPKELSGYDTIYFQIRSLSAIDDYDAGTSDTLVLNSSSDKSGTLEGSINLPVSKNKNDYVLVMSFTGNGGKVIIDDISITE
ncbi:MAG: extracellular solute-binding protein [Bacteroidaceae bacterium]|nr:extracellular solute-binding protein [Bacteroidaceae bacterium]